MKIVLTLLLLLNFVKAEFIFDDTLPPVKEEIIDYDSTSNEPEEVIPQEELNKNSEQILDDVIQTKEKLEKNITYKNSHEQNLFLTLLDAPKKVILSQRVPITIKATITREDIEKFDLSIKEDKNFKIIYKKEPWIKLNQNSYKKTIYIKYLSTTPKDLTIKVTSKFKNRLKNSAKIRVKKPKVVVLKGDEFFSKVIAKKLEVLSHSEKRYDDTHNIVLMEINATLSNLEDFSLGYAKKSGVDEYIDKGKLQKAYTYAIVDYKDKNFKFKYFDLISNHYKMINFDIRLKDQTLSTQTELNPQKNRYKQYKTIVLLSVLFVLLLIFLKKRSIGLALFMAILLVYTAYINIPFKKITLKKGVGLKILPTQNSTVFYIVPKDTKVVVAYENKKYYKVILPDGKHVGWVKKDDK